MSINAGDRFGRLVAIRDRAPGDVKIPARCDCGNTIEVRPRSLTSGNTRSCGCLKREQSAANGAARTTHGRAATDKARRDRTYTSWQSMKRRCLNPLHHRFVYYGGRGITICPEWQESFEQFLADMGERPPGTSLDRIDNDGNYEPANCRWATQSQQVSNRRRLPRAS